MRLSGRTASLVVLLALGAAAALPAGAAARTEKAQFRLVIEGFAVAQRTFSINGDVGLCNEAASGEFKQTTDFLRGKGVVLTVVRRKVGRAYEYGVKRGRGRPEFTVVVTSERGAEGTASLKPKPGLPEPLAAAAAAACNTSTDLAKTPGCGTKTTRRDDVGLKVKGNTFAVVPVGDPLAAPLPVHTCGETDVTKGMLSLDHEWPAIPETDFAPFPDEKMFNRAINAIKVLLSRHVNGEAKPIGTPPLTGTATDYGTTHATVRFIRCGERKRPAC
jgi:hypothetical protein